LVDIFGKVFTMAKMAGKAKGTPRARRTFTDEFKAGAVGLVLREGRSIASVARDLDVAQSVLRTWVERARADAGEGKPGMVSSDEREELTRLRRENRVLREERQILKKAAVLFAAKERT
jgi:transposase